MKSIKYSCILACFLGLFSQNLFADESFQTEYQCNDFQIYPQNREGVSEQDYPQELMNSQPTSIESFGYEINEERPKDFSPQQLSKLTQMMLANIPVYVNFDNGQKVKMIFSSGENSVRKYKSEKSFSGGYLYIGLDVYHPSCGEEDGEPMSAELYWRKVEKSSDGDVVKKLYLRSRCEEVGDSFLNEIFIY